MQMSHVPVPFIGLVVGAAPGQLGDGNADGAAAQQDIVSDGAADPSRRRVAHGEPDICGARHQRTALPDRPSPARHSADPYQ